MLEHSEMVPKRAQAGMTLIELLATLAIITVLGTMVATAMVTGSRIMADTTEASNASILEQSLTTALTDILRYANVQAPTGSDAIADPIFNTDSYTDYTGAAIRNGSLVLAQGRIMLSANGSTQSVPKAAGIYTDFQISDFSISYDCVSNTFSGSYTITNPKSTYTRACEFACRSLVEETYL